MSQFSRPSIFRRFWKPAAVTATCGTAGVVWFEELWIYAEVILALVFLPVLAGIIYLFNYFVFKSHFPRRDDSNYKNNREE